MARYTSQVLKILPPSHLNNLKSYYKHVRESAAWRALLEVAAATGSRAARCQGAAHLLAASRGAMRAAALLPALLGGVVLPGAHGQQPAAAAAAAAASQTWSRLVIKPCDPKAEAALAVGETVILLHPLYL